MTIQFRRQYIFYSLVLIGVIFVVHFRAYNAGFVGDDNAYIVDHSEHYQDLSTVTNYFISGVWDQSRVPLKDHNLYRPVWLSWTFLVYRFAGENPLPWHLVNLILHAINGMLVFHLAGNIFREASYGARFAASLLFILSPAGSQNVVWISGSTNILLTMLILVSFTAYARFGESRSRLWYVLSLLFFGAALLAKETALAFLPLLILLDISRPSRNGPFPWAAYGGFVAVTLGYIYLRMNALGHVAGVGTAWEFDLSAVLRMLNYGAVYLRTLFLPWPLPFTLRHPPGGVGTILDPWLGWVILGLLVYLYRYKQNLRLGIAWILLAISIPMLMALHSAGLFAVRLLYPAGAGLSMLLLPLIEHALNHQYRRWGLAGILVGMTAVVVIESGNWTDQSSWGRHLIRSDPGFPAGWFQVADDQIGRRDVEAAISTYREARNHVEEDRYRWQVNERLAKSLVGIGRPGEAMGLFQEIADMRGFEHLGWNGVGNIHFLTEEHDLAFAAYRKALEYKTDYFEALYNYGLTGERLNRREEAFNAYRALLDLPAPEGMEAVRARVLTKLRRWGLNVQE